MKQEHIDAALRIKSGDKQDIIEWINDKLYKCKAETETAEAIALTGIVAGSSVEDIVANFTRSRAKVHYQVAMIDSVTANYAHIVPDESASMKAVLREYLNRCASAGRIVDGAKVAAYSPSFSQSF